jgi:hypothetical protein
MNEVTAVDKTVYMLAQIAEVCGEYSQTRKMLIRIGKLLLRGKPKILVPVCPDYAHEGGKYTFNGLGGGVSLLTQQHIASLQSLIGILPDFEVLILMADHEADDTALVQTTGKSRDEFLALLDSSIRATRIVVEPLVWNVARMTEIIPSLIQDEKEVYQWICGNRRFEHRIIADTIQRAGMYAKYGYLNTAEMQERTARTSAQYVALGRFAARNGYLVCNHTTTNLSWYLQTDVAVLHNPIQVY